MSKSIKLNDKNWQLPEFEINQFKKKQTKYCIIIPLINEGPRIKKQLKEMQPFSKISDIIIADGGSNDGSTELEFLKSQNVRTLLVKKSPGKQGTQLRMAFAYAMKEGYEGIITIDGNNKDGVEAIPNFIKALDEGYDNIQGSRFIKGGKAINTPLIRNLGIRLLASPIISLASGFWFTDITNGFRGYSKKYITDPRVNPFRDIFIKYEFYFYLTARSNQLGFKTRETPVTRKYPSGEIPTKIHGFRSNFNVFLTCLNILSKKYHP